MTDALTAVEYLLRQNEPEARRLAVQQLTKLRGEKIPELLSLALGDEDWRVRKEAAHAAPAFEDRELVVAALVQALDVRDNIGLRNGAVEALIAIGNDSVAATVGALAKLDPDGRKLAVEVLGGVPDSRGTEALVCVLQDQDINVRVSAAEALESSAIAGEASRNVAIEALTALLEQDGEPLVKLAAFHSLGMLEVRLPFEVIEPYLRHPVLRRSAVCAAARSGDPRALQALVDVLARGPSPIAQEAIVSLSEFFCSGAADVGDFDRARATLAAVSLAIDSIRKMVASASARVRNAALIVLGAIRSLNDVPLIVRALEVDEDALSAENALRLMGSTAVLPMLNAAEQSSTSVRATAIALAAELADSFTTGVHDALRRALADESPEVISATARALCTLGEPHDLKLIAPLLGALDPRVATASKAALAALANRHHIEARELIAGIQASADNALIACIVLGAISNTSSSEVADIEFLRRALSHADPLVRRSAVEALAPIGPEVADAVAFALADEERTVQVAAARALGQLGRADLLLGVINTHADPSFLAVLLRSLGEADPESAFRVARPLVQSKEPAVAASAVEAIGKLRVNRRDDALFEALEHPDVEVVKMALTELGVQLDARAVARLGMCLDHPSWEVRRLAAEVLGQDSTNAAQALLRARLERESIPAVKQAITRAVSLTPPRPEIPSLVPPDTPGRRTRPERLRPEES